MGPIFEIKPLKIADEALKEYAAACNQVCAKKDACIPPFVHRPLTFAGGALLIFLGLALLVGAASTEGIAMVTVILGGIGWVVLQGIHFSMNADFTAAGGEVRWLRATHYQHLVKSVGSFNAGLTKARDLTEDEEAIRLGVDGNALAPVLKLERDRIEAGFRAHLLAAYYDKYAAQKNDQTNVILAQLHHRMQAAFNAALRLDAGLDPTEEDLLLPPLKDILAELLERAERPADKKMAAFSAPSEPVKPVESENHGSTTQKE